MNSQSLWMIIPILICLEANISNCEYSLDDETFESGLITNSVRNKMIYFTGSSTQDQ